MSLGCGRDFRELFKTMKNVALMPLKANSERVPGKNFRLFCGKPLFRWMLDTLLATEDVDLIVINTDARAELEANGLEANPRAVRRMETEIFDV